MTEPEELTDGKGAERRENDPTIPASSSIKGLIRVGHGASVKKERQHAHNGHDPQKGGRG